MAEGRSERTVERESTGGTTSWAGARDRTVPSAGAETRGAATGARSPKKSHPVLFRSKSDIFAFIETHHAQGGVSALCRRYLVTTAGFYAWRRRGESDHAKQDRVLSKEIERVFALHRERYGSPRIHDQLKKSGWRVSL